MKTEELQELELYAPVLYKGTICYVCSLWWNYNNTITVGIKDDNGNHLSVGSEEIEKISDKRN